MHPFWTKSFLFDTFFLLFIFSVYYWKWRLFFKRLYNSKVLTLFNFCLFGSWFECEIILLTLVPLVIVQIFRWSWWRRNLDFLLWTLGTTFQRSYLLSTLMIAKLKLIAKLVLLIWLPGKKMATSVLQFFQAYPNWLLAVPIPSS